MIGAKLFNEKNDIVTNEIYGCVTTGDDWVILRLKKDLEIDIKKYYLGNISELLGVLQHIVNQYKIA
jgi:hypothetical protein